MQGYYDAPSVLSPRSSVRGGVHDSMVMSSGVFPDTDSGFSSSFKGKNLQHSDDFMASPRSQQASPGALVKARSMSRLNSPFVSQEMTPFTLGPYHLDRSLRNLKGNLEDSENRRCVLMHKLKEAQDTLELQSDRLAKIENAAKGNSILVEDLKLKERDYRKRIDCLKITEQEKDILKMENIKLRQEMQDRIDKLDFALRSLQAQHQVTENENQKRISLLEQTSHAMSLLETENNRLQQDNSTMKQEMAVAKEAIHLARSKFEPMEDENKNLRVETLRLKEENAELSKKVSELTGQLMELRKLTQSMKDENEKLAESWKTLSEDKQRISKQLDGAQEKTTDLRSKVSTASAEKDRLFQEKMDLNNKFQQLLINKEQLERTKILLEEQLNDQSTEVARAKQTSKKRDEEKKRLEEEIHDMKRAEQDLSSELASVRAYYERALEQISTLESGKKVQQQQNDWNTQEQERLKAEVDRLSKVSEGKTKELKREKEEMEESIQNLKGELRNLRSDNSLLENKVEELETKLNKANEDIKYSATTSQEELDTWKDTCDRLTASVSRKESEVQALSDKCLDLEDVTGKLHSENRVLKDECDHLSEQVEDIKKLKDQNRKLIQEKAENEQMIKLLETQKEVLTKSSENQLAKLHDVEHLTHKVDQFRNENEHLRERVLELEKVRDNLVEQKEDLLASTELIYKKPKLEELEKRIDELREANKQLRDINEDVNEKVDSLEQMSEPITGFSYHLNGALLPANIELREAVGGDGSVVPKYDLERVRDEKERIESGMDNLRRDYDALIERHDQYVQDYGPDGEEVLREKNKVRGLEREKEGLEKQVALINGQLLLVESSKKRLDEVVEDLQHEIVHLRKELEEAEKQPVGGAELDQLQSEVEELRNELTRSQKEKMKQENLVRSLKEDLDDERSKNPSQIRESLDDVGTELNGMRGELHKLMGVIQSKDQAIETLENQLRQSKEKIEDRDKEMLELKTYLKDKNVETAKSYEDIPKRSDDGKSTEPQRTQSLTEKGSGDRLQSLISKYRSYGETSQQPERKIKPLSLTGSNKMGLVTRGRSFGPAAPKGSDGKVSPVTEVENEGDLIPQLPKTPPPIIRVTTPDDEGPLAQSSPTVFTLAGPDSQDGKAPGRVAVSQDEGAQSGEEYDYDDDDDLDTQEQRDINSLIQNCYRSHLKFLVALRRDRGQSSRKSGGGKKRATHPKPILSVSPPKLTSKVIGDLLRTHPTSEQTKSHPGSPDPTPANQSPGSPKSSSANPDMSN